MKWLGLYLPSNIMGARSTTIITPDLPTSNFFLVTVITRWPFWKIAKLYNIVHHHPLLKIFCRFDLLYYYWQYQNCIEDEWKILFNIKKYSLSISKVRLLYFYCQDIRVGVTRKKASQRGSLGYWVNRGWSEKTIDSKLKS